MRVPLVWGVINATPDSFSDGGRHADVESAVRHARLLAEEGADVLDVGGESTRPGAAPVEPAEEIRRVVPVLARLRELDLGPRLSVDTRRAQVAREALAAGATVINDVGAGADPGMADAVAGGGAEWVLLHMRGTPATMQQAPRYQDVVAEVEGFLRGRVAAAEAAGIPRERLWIDPGLGFGKTLEHNLALLRGLERFVALGVRVLVGASRKSFLGALTGRTDPTQRLAGSLACALRACCAGVHGVRVHDVGATRDALAVLAGIR